jgi:hypothetical protein
VDFFGVLLGVPRGAVEEGGPTVFLLCVGGFGVLLGSVHNGGLYI